MEKRRGRHVHRQVFLVQSGNQPGSRAQGDLAWNLSPVLRENHAGDQNLFAAGYQPDQEDGSGGKHPGRAVLAPAWFFYPPGSEICDSQILDFLRIRHPLPLLRIRRARPGQADKPAHNYRNEYQISPLRSSSRQVDAGPVLR